MEGSVAAIDDDAGLWRLVRLALVAFTLAGCPATPAPPAPSEPAPAIEPLLAKLQSPHPDVRDVAAADLTRFPSDGMDMRTRLMLLTEAARELPEGDGARSAEVTLVERALERENDGLLPLLDHLRDHYPDAAIGPILEHIGRWSSRSAASTYARYLERYLTQPNVGDGGIPFGSLYELPRHADLLLPRLLVHALHPAHGWEIRRLMLRLCHADESARTYFTPYAPAFIDAYRRHAEALWPQQRAALGVFRLRDETYGIHRSEASLWLDLFGCLPDRLGESTLRRALSSYDDPKLRYFALASLFRRGQPVPTRAVLSVARELEVRAWLVDLLLAREQLGILPEPLRSQAAVAASDLAAWLSYEADPPRLADPILLAQKVVLPPQTDEYGEEVVAERVYYVFRFEIDEPDGGRRWVAGVAGAYASGPRAFHHDGTTGSAFEDFDSRTPEEHLEAYLGATVGE